MLSGPFTPADGDQRRSYLLNAPFRRQEVELRSRIPGILYF